MVEYFTDSSGVLQIKCGNTTFIQVTIPEGGVSASVAHGMAGTPRVGKPNPNKEDGLNCWATADGTNLTVHTAAPVSSDVTFTVPVSI